MEGRSIFRCIKLGNSFQIMRLEEDEYQVFEESKIFSNLPLSEIGNFLQQVRQFDYLELSPYFLGHQSQKEFRIKLEKCE